MAVRSVRNNNPGNLNAGEAWQGLMPRDQMSKDQLSETRFAVFASPKWGFRAMGIILRNYQRVHGLNTVRQIISRWAPPSENATDAYIKGVCNAIGKEPDAPIDVSDPAVLTGLCKAISVHEAGGWFFSQADLEAGVALADASP